MGKAYPRDRGDQKRFHPDSGVVHLLLGKARINDVDDTIDRQRRLSNVSGNNNFPASYAILSWGWRLQIRTESCVQKSIAFASGGRAHRKPLLYATKQLLREQPKSSKQPNKVREQWANGTGGSSR